jgi:hypothetical protein
VGTNVMYRLGWRVRHIAVRKAEAANTKVVRFSADRGEHDISQFVSDTLEDQLRASEAEFGGSS